MVAPGFLALEPFLVPLPILPLEIRISSIFSSEDACMQVMARNERQLPTNYATIDEQNAELLLCSGACGPSISPHENKEFNIRKILRCFLCRVSRSRAVCTRRPEESVHYLA